MTNNEQPQTFEQIWQHVRSTYPIEEGFHITLKSPGFYSDGRSYSIFPGWYCLIQRGASETAAVFTEWGEGLGDTEVEAIQAAINDLKGDKQ